MATFVLIHGAFHGGWCWEKVVPLLEARGHRAVAPDLPGMGDDQTPYERITLGSTAEHVANLVLRQPEPVILAAHSLGGVVIAETAERIPERIAGLVFVAAVLTHKDVPAQALLDEFPPAEMIPSADGLSVSSNLAQAASIFYNASSEEDTKRAIARLRPQPSAVMLGADLTASLQGFGRLPRAYVECTEDRAVSIGFQRRMQARLPCEPVFTLKSDHSPFLCAPQELADSLVAAAERFAAQ